MNAVPENSDAPAIRPPQLIQSLVGGFNAVASHVYLILLPVLLDLVLWFGPHVQIKTAMQPALDALVRYLRQQGSADTRPLVDVMQQQWQTALNQYNLLSSLSTLPVGVPTLMGDQMPMKTPVGAPTMFEVHSVTQFLLFWLVLSLVGLALGSLYFAGIARSTGAANAGDCAGPLGAQLPGSRMPPFRAGTLAWEMMQVLALVIMLVGIVAVLMIPALIIAVLLSLASPFLAQIALLLVFFSAVWFMIPLIFSPHGIFLCGQGVLNAMLNSARVVRTVLPGTGFFVLVVFILNQGLGLLWRTPPETSWMALVGVLGHAFIITGLLAASFVYYRSGLAYVQALRQIMLKRI